ncbi:MAG: hypothetical protein HZA46_08210 [Planctomycetales bacterium]|nr:hypothetical protein [Planctomycetales bacterium]
MTSMNDHQSNDSRASEPRSIWRQVFECLAICCLLANIGAFVVSLALMDWRWWRLTQNDLLAVTTLGSILSVPPMAVVGLLISTVRPIGRDLFTATAMLATVIVAVETDIVYVFLRSTMN